MNGLRSVILGGLSVAVVSLLAGCVGVQLPDELGNPGTKAKPSPTSSESTQPTRQAPQEDRRDLITAIVIDGDSVSLRIDENNNYDDIPFTTDPADAVERLNDGLQSKASLNSQAPPFSACWGTGTEADWGGFKIGWWPGSNWSYGAKFIAIATKKATNNGMPILMSNGLGVGDELSNLEAFVPEENIVEVYAPAGQFDVYYSVAHGTKSLTPNLENAEQFWGGLANIENGVVKTFESPIMYELLGAC